ncbi:MAG: phenylalanine--tRNA ligase subunit alpha [Firmicutes bacterium]|nr:phenylalanine--tRNA ligase subunit alpha [Bacillota bacterium]MCM1394487.1 phenylalanine--tRNA ligase subunit alpha [[Eubacterium] siraeum]
MKEKLDGIKLSAIAMIDKAATTSELNDVRVKYLGKNGEISLVMRDMANVPKEERPAMGKLVNELRSAVEGFLNDKTAVLAKQEEEAKLKAEAIDVTLPAYGKRLGTLHPLTLIRRELIDIFLGMGFSVDEGPEIESDLFNFQLLNIPKDHPSRDMQDTFYVNDNVLLRTQTSAMQARIMTKQQPPIRVVVPGKVYRSDDDASHSPIFNQFEGLAVDKHITMGDLQGCLQTFAQKIFSKDTKVRLRPSYFPFTEPSVEVDVTCSMCHGKGCRVCKGTGWVEILGAGIVNPAVLDMCGIDSKEYSGFAFGFGIDRIAMIKYGIPNIKLLYENDVRFLKQFN